VFKRKKEGFGEQDKSATGRVVQTPGGGEENAGGAIAKKIKTDKIHDVKERKIMRVRGKEGPEKSLEGGRPNLVYLLDKSISWGGPPTTGGRGGFWTPFMRRINKKTRGKKNGSRRGEGRGC